jgi:hypothetical protein
LVGVAFSTALFTTTTWAADRLVGVTPTDGSAALVKAFTVEAGTQITGIEFESNAATYGEVALLQGSGNTLAGAEVLTWVTNASASAGTVTVTWPMPVEVEETGEYWVAVHLPAAAAKLGLNNEAAPTGSFLAPGEAEALVPIRGDLAISLTTSSNASMAVRKPEGEAQVRPQETFLRVSNAGPRTIHIDYGLHQAANVTLTVYDVAGRAVREVFEGQRPSGLHRQSWSGQDAQGRTVARGVYILRLEADDRVFTQRIVFTR